MKKFFYFFAASLVAFSFASCEPNKPSIPSDDDNDDKPKKEAAFQITMGEVTATDASFIITPADPETAYFWTVYPKCFVEWRIEYDENVSSEEDYLKLRLASFSPESEELRMPRIIELPEPVNPFRTGTAAISAEEVREVVSSSDYALCPNTEFHIAVCKIDENYQVVGDIVYQTFNTLFPEGYVDLGLESHILWNCNYVLDEGEPVYYTRSEASWLEEFAYIPYKDWWEELRENCNWSWNNDLSSVNGDSNYKDIRGYVVTGPNGNKIYLPAVGGKNQSGTITDVGYNGNYWAFDLPTSSTGTQVWFGSGSSSFSFNDVSADCALSVCLICLPAEWYYD